MDHQIIKIYNSDDFETLTKGIKVAKCMRFKTSILEATKMFNDNEELVVSNALSCSYCNTVFQNKVEQRLHYKLDWHRYNLKQHLSGLKSVTKNNFNLLTNKESSSSSNESGESSDESDREGEEVSPKTDSSEGSSQSSKVKSEDVNEKLSDLNISTEMADDEDDDEDDIDEDADEDGNTSLEAMAARHSKVFFENDDGVIFSLYRCLLHNHKECPEIEEEMVAKALGSKQNLLWTIIMVGGGNFAAAVFSDGKPLVHKTFHSYTVRSKQGFQQSSKDNRNASNPKSAGASLRRYNETAFLQHVQDILDSWTSQIAKSSLILYRASGPYNRSVLFGGKNAPLNKTDARLRRLPFPTRRATFTEVKRVFDILSSLEIYGHAEHFTDRFPISPRQFIPKKTPKATICNSSTSSPNEKKEFIKPTSTKSPSGKKNEKQSKGSRSQIDRGKARKSPHRPLPDIIIRLAQSSSESEFDALGVYSSALVEEDQEVDLKGHLSAFDCKMKKRSKRKVSGRKN